MNMNPKSGSGSSQKQELDQGTTRALPVLMDLPIELRVPIYNKLNLESLLQTRLVSSRIKEEIDSNVPFHVQINSNDDPFLIKKLFDLRVHSVKYYPCHGHADPTPNDNDLAEPALQWEWDNVFRFPNFVQSLDFGNPWGHFQEFGETWQCQRCGFVSEELIFKALQECENLRALKLNFIKLVGPTLTPEKNLELSAIIKGFKTLNHIETNFKPTLDQTRIRALALIATLLTDLYSPVLNSISVMQYSSNASGTWRHPVLKAPWAIGLKLASRHWRTLRSLSLEVSESLSVGTEWIQDKELEDLTKITQLTKLNLDNQTHSGLLIHPRVKDFLVQFINRQRALETFSTNLISHGNLTLVIQYNYESLKSLQICNVGLNNEVGLILDMDLFSPCSQLEPLTISLLPRASVHSWGTSTDSENFRVINLRGLPSSLTKLTLIGSRLRRPQHLLELSHQCQNLRSINLELIEFRQMLGLSGILAQVVQNLHELQDLRVSFEETRPLPGIIHVPPMGQDDTRDVEMPRVIKLFERFESHEIIHQFVNAAGGVYTPEGLEKTSARAFDEWSFLCLEGFRFEATNISTEDRVSILNLGLQ